MEMALVSSLFGRAVCLKETMAKHASATFNAFSSITVEDLLERQLHGAG